MARGFVFSLDAAFSIVVAALVIYAAASLSAETKIDPYHEIILEKQGNDVLTVLDKNGGFYGANYSSLEYYLNGMLPNSTSWNIRVDYYNYSSGFVLEQNISHGEPYTDIDDLVSVQREFIIMENGSIRHLGLARLRLWTE